MSRHKQPLPNKQHEAEMSRPKTSLIAALLKGEKKPARREELIPIAFGATILSFIALIVCYGRGYMLMYGDAVAHLAIARRITDSRNAGIAQLGGVWLPLPHLLILPFVQNMAWWHNGLAGAWPSLSFYIISVVGIYRLSRWMLDPRWALACTAFYALNPNLLYLSTTAMTEPLFLAELIWLTLVVVEFIAAIRKHNYSSAAKQLILSSLLIAAAALTRYDGWVLGAVAWCVQTWELSRNRAAWKALCPSFVVFTLVAIAAPLSWLFYNHYYFHDWLDFLRGPYSAGAIEKKTSPVGSRHYRGWHNPGWALLFYTRTAQIDSALWESGFVVMLMAVLGLAIAKYNRAASYSALLWVPLPFYVYSISFASVPIFIPQLWPHSFYNSRYGIEMLPALSLYCMVGVTWIQCKFSSLKILKTRFLFPAVIASIVANSIGMTLAIPLVLKEAIVNSTTRMAFETALAQQIRTFPSGAPILMYNSDHVGALQDAEIPLKQTLNEGDYDSWMPALSNPAEHAEFVIAIAGDPVSRAVAKNPQGLTELMVLCTTGQPCARIYHSEKYAMGVY